MTLAAGTRLGSYEITGVIGAGGMGEVYRARDTKLNRDVAIKVLPELFVADPDRVKRFEREAQTLAALNHPNIAQIYGVIENPAALVMEFVDGEDLAQRLTRGPLPLDEALAIARQLIDALEAAHERGIIHRDLKPANIKMSADGVVKVLDFGLAKAMAEELTNSTNLANSPTFTSPVAMTQMGVILGTAAYMAPEQARGKAADRRADIWAFGCVLYEMLTGRRPFDGEDVSSTLANVLKDDVRWDALPAGTPASILRLLRRCLEKDPKRRLSAIGDARLELEEAEVVSLPPPAAAGRSARGMAFGVAAALALAAIAAVAAWYAKPAAAIPLRLLELPASAALSKEVVLSPDGARVAYFLDGHLYVRALDSRAVQDLGSMSAGADNPFWSPDNRTVGFTAESEIRTVPAAGGPVFVVCRIPATGAAIAATWLRDGTIVFAAWRENVYAVPAAGGTPVVAMAIDPATEIDVHHISAVPDGRLIVKIHQRSGDRGVTALVDPRATGANQRRLVLTDDQTIDHVDYAPPGFLIFDRERTNVGLWAAPFSVGSIDLTKATLLQAGAGAAGVADDGSLIFVQPAASKVSPAWVDRAGVLSATLGGPFARQAAGFALSPDGRRVAVIVGTENDWSTSGHDATLVVRDLRTGVDTPLTVRRARQGPATTESLWDLAWFPSGDRILLTLGEVEAEKLVVQKADDATPPRELAAKLTMGRLTSDGRTLAALDDERGWFHLVYAPVSADGAAGATRRVFQEDDPDVAGFDLSPDGRFVVFTQRLPDRRRGIFLSEFPNGTNRWQVADNATRPRFSPDGREIFYVGDRSDARGQPERALMSRTLSTKPSVTLGAATALFGGEAAAVIDQYGYSVAPDGRRFLTVKDVAPAAGEGKRIMWMQNWPAAMKK